MTVLRVVSWNLGYWTPGAGYKTIVNRTRQWEWLASLDPDLVLVQECRPEDVVSKLPAEASDRYVVIGEIPRGWTACSAVVARRDLDPRPVACEGKLRAILSGYLALAAVTLPDGMTALAASVHTPARQVEAGLLDAGEFYHLCRPELGEVWHNDVAVGVLDPLAAQFGAFIVGGDWNTCRAFDRYPEFGEPSCEAWFADRAEAGWCEALRKFSAEEQRTYLKPGTRPFELDHVFTDRTTHESLSLCRVETLPEGLSDHAPIIAEYDLPADAAASLAVVDLGVEADGVGTVSEERFGAVRDEWLALVGAVAAGRVEGWEARFAVAKAERDQLVGERRWVGGPGDLLGVLGLQRWELSHSAVVAWLLSPWGRHLLGRALLRKLLEHCFGEGDYGPLDGARPMREVARPQCQADIVVEAEGFTLVIENKVDADEGPRQCQRIYDDFCEDPNPLFLFLSPGGDEPCTTETDAAKEAWKTLSYRCFADLLEGVLPPDGPHDPAGWTVHNYLMTLRREFG